MEKEKVNYLAIILAFCVVIAGLGGFWIGTYFGEKNVSVTKENESNKNNGEVDNEKEIKLDLSVPNELKRINEELNKNLSANEVVNVISSDNTPEKNRILFAKSLVEKQFYSENSINYESFKIVDLKTKFEEIYGNLYNFENEFNVENVNVYFDKCEIKDDSVICSQIIADNSEELDDDVLDCDDALFIVKNVIDKNNNYNITGIIIYGSSQVLEFYNFEMKLIKSNDKMYLSEFKKNYIENVDFVYVEKELIANNIAADLCQ